MSVMDDKPRVRIGETAKFKDPDKGEIKAEIIDETTFIPDENYSPNRRYWRGIELLKWSEDYKELRFCYKIKMIDKNGRYRWVNGGQTSLNLSIPTFKKLYKEIKEKGWLN